MQPNTIALGTFPIESLPRGEYVHRILVCKACNGDGAHDQGLCSACNTKGYIIRERVWIRGAYDRSTKRYALWAWDDANRETFIKRGTLVEAGFTF